jgi:CSLREA domain-containing protein
MKRVSSRALLLALTLLILTASRAAATTFVPTTTSDGNNGSCTPSLCTLRDAIIAANASSGNEVSVPAGNYTLNLGQLEISQSMTVFGAGARTTRIDAQGTSRVIYVGPSNTVAIRDLTITGGMATGSSSPFPGEGGGILTEGILNLQRSAVVGNSATITGGGLSAPFKGDATSGDVATTIEDSLVASNSVTGGGGAGSGGGLNLFGDATIVNSTITQNSVSNPGGNEGGGITSAANFWSANPGSLTLLNTTIAGNSISGTTPASDFGGGLSGANFNIVPVTPPILSNLTAKNTIIAGNTVDGTAQDCSQVNTVSTARNLSGDATCGFTDPGSKQNTSPRLGPLADNGGPTDTLKPADSSPAKNIGDNGGCPGADQRGVGRPQALFCDIGAVELKAPDLQLTQKRLGKKGFGKSVASESRKRRKRGFLISVTNRGEQSATAAQLVIRLRGKAKKVRVSAGCTKKKKKKKGRLKRTKLLGCNLGNLAPEATTKVRLRLRPTRRTRKLVSTATVSNLLGESTPKGHSAKTVLRFKRK